MSMATSFSCKSNDAKIFSQDFFFSILFKLLYIVINKILGERNYTPFQNKEKSSNFKNTYTVLLLSHYKKPSERLKTCNMLSAKFCLILLEFKGFSFF